MIFQFRRLSATVLAVALTYSSAPVICGQDSVVKVPMTIVTSGDNPFVGLTIGSPAPHLNIEHWLSDGNGKWPHVTQFEPGKVYLVEFWATWCGPCLKALPRLVDLQNQYAEQGVQFISISDESLAKIQPFLAKQVPSGGPTPDAKSEPMTYGELVSGYSLTSDPDRSVGKDYMLAAGQSGIPCGFLVGKTGLIEWIGHPAQVEEPLAAILSGNWNRDEFAKEFKPKQLRDAIVGMLEQALGSGDMQQAKSILGAAKQYATEDPELAAMLDDVEFQMKLEPVQKHLEYGEFDDALERLNQIAKTATPAQKMMLSMATVTVLMAKGDFDDAAKTIREITASEAADIDTLYSVAVQVAESSTGKAKIPEALTDAAIAAIQKAGARLPPNHPRIVSTMKQLEKMKAGGK